MPRKKPSGKTRKHPLQALSGKPNTPIFPHGIMNGRFYEPGIEQVVMPSGKYRLVSRKAYEQFARKAQKQRKTIGEVIQEEYRKAGFDE